MNCDISVFCFIMNEHLIIIIHIKYSNNYVFYDEQFYMYILLLAIINNAYYQDNKPWSCSHNLKNCSIIGY